MNVSVIIAAYNCEQYIEQCIDSILSSHMEGLEIIAVDDGSKDLTSEILDCYASCGSVKVIHRENGGASSARNAGLEMAQGDYIGFVDADDWVEPDMFPKMYQEARNRNADIVFCNIYRNESEKMRQYIESGVYNQEKIHREIFPQLICSTQEKIGKITLRGSTWCKIFRRALLEENSIRYHEDLVYNEDAVFCIEATIRAVNYVYLGEEYLYHNRVTPGSLTKRYISNLWNRQKVIVDYIESAVTETSYDFSNQISHKMLEVAIYCIENECKADNPCSTGKAKEAIKEIASSHQVEKALDNIDWRKLSNIKKAYYWAIRLKSPVLAMAVAKHRASKHQKGQRNG